MLLKDKKDEVELMTFNLNYSRWYDLYFPKAAAALIDPETGKPTGGTLVADEIEIPVTEIDELDAFYNSRENKKWMGSGQIPLEFVGLENVGTGRRV